MSANAGCQYNVECLFLGEHCISADQAAAFFGCNGKFTLEAFVSGKPF